MKDTNNIGTFGEETVTFPLIINGALFATTLVLLQNLLATNNLNIWQLIALIMFSVSLPCLGAYSAIIYKIHTSKVDPQLRARAFLFLQYIAIITSFLGIFTSIFNSSWIAGCVFLIMSVIAIALWSKTHAVIDDIYSEINQKPKQK